MYSSAVLAFLTASENCLYRSSFASLGGNGGMFSQVQFITLASGSQSGLELACSSNSDNRSLLQGVTVCLPRFMV